MIDLLSGGWEEESPGELCLQLSLCQHHLYFLKDGVRKRGGCGLRWHVPTLIYRYRDRVEGLLGEAEQ